MNWKKENGQEIETNDEPATIEHCKSIGWEPIEVKEKRAYNKKEKESE